MTRKSTPSLSLQARQLQQRVSALVRHYETSLGSIPVWFEELDPDAALRLIAACLRIGMRLPAEETLGLDMEAREQAQSDVRFRGSSRGEGPSGLAS